MKNLIIFIILFFLFFQISAQTKKDKLMFNGPTHVITNTPLKEAITEFISEGRGSDVDKNCPFILLSISEKLTDSSNYYLVHIYYRDADWFYDNPNYVFTECDTILGKKIIYMLPLRGDFIGTKPQTITKMVEPYSRKSNRSTKIDFEWRFLVVKFDSEMNRIESNYFLYDFTDYC